jgi:hypothetical protein
MAEMSPDIETGPDGRYGQVCGSNIRCIWVKFNLSLKVSKVTLICLSILTRTVVEAKL